VIPLYAIGVDLALVADHSAVVVLQRTGWVEQRPTFHAIHAERLPRGVGHPLVVSHVARVCRALNAGARPSWLLAVDATGVGAPILADLRDVIPRAVGVTISGGESAGGTRADARVSKAVLVGGLQVALERRRLSIDPTQAHADLLVGELAAYTAETTSSGATTWNARAGANDDLVLSLALAWWLGNRDARRPATVSSAANRSVVPRAWESTPVSTRIRWRR
jgi:hypothetical protein